MPDSEHVDENIIRGCQSKVWLNSEQRDGHLYFKVDSDAFIVKGLLGVVLAAYNSKTPQQVLDFDIESYFNELDLMSHLSPTRGSGLQAMVARIKNIAASAA
ncbi:MAG: SufE family protein [Pseudohongiella sp.]